MGIVLGGMRLVAFARYELREFFLFYFIGSEKRELGEVSDYYYFFFLGEREFIYLFFKCP